MRNSAFYIVLLFVAGLMLGCNRSGEIKIQNRISKTIISNVYWGENYIGGNLKPGQETEYIKIDRSQEKLPASLRVYFSVEADLPTAYYTEEKFTLDRKGQLFVVLSDTTVIYEVGQ